MVRAAIGVLCSLVIFSVVGAAADKDGLKKYTGKLKSVDKKESTFTLIIDGKDLEFLATDETKFYGPDKKALKDGLKAECLKPGVEVSATASAEGARIAKEVWCGGAKKNEDKKKE
jgi:hypothetical protein